MREELEAALCRIPIHPGYETPIRIGNGRTWRVTRLSWGVWFANRGDKYINGGIVAVAEAICNDA